MCMAKEVCGKLHPATLRVNNSCADVLFCISSQKDIKKIFGTNAWEYDQVNIRSISISSTLQSIFTLLKVFF